MATLPKARAADEPFHHDYYAKADILSAKIKQPLEKEVESEVLQLPQDGGYKFTPAQPFRLEGIISYDSGYTQVAGHRSSKTGHGFTTLTTSVVEGLNILDVITADRVVGQISTEHPIFPDGQVPSVMFLGTRFDNLRIGGHKVEVKPCLHILGPKPAGDKSYFEDEGVFKRISGQYRNINKVKGLPMWASQQYRWSKAATFQDKRKPRENTANCSLVSGVQGAPGISFGHVIDLPHFGKIFLAELKVHRKKAQNHASKASPPEHDTYRFHLTMIRLDLGCIAHGSANIIVCDSNGGGGRGTPNPPPPPPPLQ